MKRAGAIILLTLALASLVQAEQHPNLERGFKPERVYNFHDIDSVNVFNGNLTISIPVGMRYPNDGTSSWGFTLTYNSKLWEFEERVDTGGDPDIAYFMAARPSRRSNAGFGWLLSLGRLIAPTDSLWAPSPPRNYSDPTAADPAPWTYESPSGAEHTFVGIGADPTLVTMDGSYLRLRTISPTVRAVDFPDGSIHTFTAAGSRYYLTSMTDPFGNSVTVNQYSTSQWTLSDRHGRTATVLFEDRAGVAADTERVVTEVRLPAPGTPTTQGSQGNVSYLFNYTNFVVSYGCTGTPYPSYEASAAAVPRLNSVTLPDGSQFQFQYNAGDAGNCEQGTIRQMTLPTGGQIDYEYGQYVLGAGDCWSHFIRSSTGVRKRRLIDYASFPGPTTAEWTYTPRGVTMESQCSEDCSITLKPEFVMSSGGTQIVVAIKPRVEGATTVKRPDNTTTTHYFSIYDRVDCGLANGEVAIDANYGLPFTPLNVTTDPEGRKLYLSTETKDASGTPVQRTYVRYARDSQPYDSNERVEADRTVIIAGSSEKYSEVVREIWDGYGHYRSEMRRASSGFGAQRTTFTNYNPGSSGALTTAGPGLPQSLWNLGMFDRVEVTEAGATQRTDLCFDATTGFLKGKRTRLNANAESNADIIALFDHDRGNVITEKWFGGDTKFGASPPAPPSVCGSIASSGATYEIQHQYLYGVRKKTSRPGVSFFELDLDIDKWSGLPLTSRDASLIPTEYRYDPMGRLVSERPSGLAWTDYAYRNWSPTLPAEVTATKRANGGTAELARSRFEFDRFGRLSRTYELMPDSLESFRETLYDGMGRQASTSEFGRDASKRTELTHDFFGRPLEIKGADQSKVKLEYLGTVEKKKTVTVRTSGDHLAFGTTESVTTEKFDAWGRLVEVLEPNNTRTKYEYDYADRLVSVCVNAADNPPCPGQQRSFTYDGRGFLISETHPERGTSFYSSFDARGKLWRKREGQIDGPFDVEYQFDPAERPTLIRLRKAPGGTLPRTLKKFEYGTSGNANGKILTATRYNWIEMPALVNMQVRETYEYNGLGGKVSARTTEQFNCVVNPDTGETCEELKVNDPNRRKFVMSMEYDGLAQRTSVAYPSCVFGCSGVGAGPTITNAFTRGRLTSVTYLMAGVPRVNTIAYHPNGMMSRVDHSNGVVDEQELDPSGLPRPRRLTTSNVSVAGNCVAPSITLHPVSTSIPPNETRTLTADVTADSDPAHPLTLQWFAGSTPVPNSNSKSLVVHSSQANSYWMRASNNCGPNSTTVSADTNVAIVSVCSLPAITQHPQNSSVTRGLTSTTLRVFVADASSVSFQWYEGFPGQTTTQVGTGSEVLVSPQTTRTYWVAIRNSCGTTNSAAATVTVYEPPTAPTGLVAATDGTKAIVTWIHTTPPAGRLRYELDRFVDGQPFAPMNYSLTAAIYDDTAVAARKTYVYRIRVVDTNSAASPWSVLDYTTVGFFTDEPLRAPNDQNGTVIRAAHISELRESVDAVRRSAGLDRVWTTYTPSGVVMASHLTQMRQSLNQARMALGLPPLTFPEASITPGVTLIRRQHVQELRDGVR